MPERTSELTPTFTIGTDVARCRAIEAKDPVQHQQPQTSSHHLLTSPSSIEGELLKASKAKLADIVNANLQIHLPANTLTSSLVKAKPCHK